MVDEKIIVYFCCCLFCLFCLFVFCQVSYTDLDLRRQWPLNTNGERTISETCKMKKKKKKKKNFIPSVEIITTSNLPVTIYRLEAIT